MNKSFFTVREKCPACQSLSYNVLYQSPYDTPPVGQYLESFYHAQGGVDFDYLENANYCLCECTACNLIFQQEIPNEQLMSILYEKWIDPKKGFDQHRHTDQLGLYSNYAHEISMIIDFFDSIPSSLDLFDFGMGWGKWASMARAFGCNAYGAELSREKTSYAASNGIAIVQWDEIPKNKFDFINTEQVFEHLSDPLFTLQHLKKSLKPNGLIKISVPTANDISRRLEAMDWTAPKGTRNSLNAVAPLEHINFFRRRSVIKMAESAGMKEVRIPMRIQYRQSCNWKGINRTARNLLLPIYRNILKRQNYLFFQSAHTSL